MRHLLLFLVFVSFAASELIPICTDGYTLVNEEKCWKLFTNVSSYKAAEATCSSIGGTLPLLKNNIDNRALTSFVGNAANQLWMGVYCLDSDPTSCLWDDDSGSAGAFNNFAKGYPYTPVGNCVYYSTTGSSAGKWYSTDCVDNLNPFVCEMPLTFAGNCQFNYNGNCYFHSLDISSTLMLPFNRAQEYCKHLGANLASIHSASEARYLKTKIAVRYNPVWYTTPFTFLGGVKDATGSYHWIDSSKSDFGNFLTDATTGCIGYDYFFSWSTRNCETVAPFLCKRPAGGQPAPPVAPITVAPFPTNSPGCNTSILIAPGEITSPNYPNNYDNDLTCTYSLLTLGPSQIYLTIISFCTDINDKLLVYNGDSESNYPLSTLSGCSASSTTITSNSNRLFLVFKTDSKVSNIGFHIRFDSYP